MLAALAQLTTRRPRAVIAAWLLVAAGCAVFAFGLAGRLADRGFAVPGSDSARVTAIMRRSIPGHAGAELFAVARVRTADPHWPDDATAAVRRALLRFRVVAQVRYEAASIVDATTGSVIVAILLRADAAEAEKHVPELRAALARASRSGRRLQLTGAPVVAERYGSIARRDLERAELLSLPLIAIVLLIAFQAPLAALLPLVLAGVTLLVAFAFLAAMGERVGLSVFVVNTASILALGLGIDFSLFLMTRFRQELAAAGSLLEALVRTMTTTGRTVLLSALTIATSLVGLLLVGVGVFTSMALAATVMTLLAALAALTLLPALIVAIGPRIEWLRIDRVARAAARARVWNALGRVVTGHPVLALVGSTAVLVVLALPAASLKLEVKTVQDLPRGEPVRRAAGALGGPATIVTRDRLSRVAALIGGSGGVQQVWDTVEGSGGWSSMQAILQSAPDSAASRAQVARMRRTLARDPRRTYVGGITAGIIDLTHRVDVRARWVVLVTVALGFVMLAWALRSLVIPAKAVLTTLLSAAATLGVLVRVSGGPHLEYFVPLVLFAILFGLSVDYEVFLLSRIRDAVEEGQEHRAAVRAGLVRSGRSITLAGLTLMLVFAAFSRSSLGPFRQLGTGLALAVVLDVTIVRCVLVPAAVVLLGRWNWWFPIRGPLRLQTALRSARGQRR
jgi:RND superfamily putative drug exporter